MQLLKMECIPYSILYTFNPLHALSAKKNKLTKEKKRNGIYKIETLAHQTLVSETYILSIQQYIDSNTVKKQLIKFN